MAKKIYLSPSNQYANSYAYGNTTEMEQCNKIAIAAETALKRCGFSVKRAPKGQNMYTSISESNNFGADVHVCIHTNAGGGKGTNVFVYNRSAENLKYAQPVYNELVKLTGVGRGISKNELAEINSTHAKCVYCECEFHDSSNLAKWIINNTTKLGEAICKGLCTAFGVTYKANASVAHNKITTESKLKSKAYAYGDCKNICIMPKNSSITHIYDDGYGWSKIKYKNKTGFVQNTRINNNSSLSKYPKMTANATANIYTHPDKKVKFGIIPKGTRVTVRYIVERGKNAGMAEIAYPKSNSIVFVDRKFLK